MMDPSGTSQSQQNQQNQVSKEDSLIQTWDQELYSKLLAHRKTSGNELVKIIDLVVSLLRQDEAKVTDLGTRIAGAYLEIASSEPVWTSFDNDVISPVCDDFKNLVEQLRKRYCTLYSSLINRCTRKYYRCLARITTEPVGVHPDFIKICNLFLEANASLKRYQVDQSSSTFMR